MAKGSSFWDWPEEMVAIFEPSRQRDKEEMHIPTDVRPLAAYSLGYDISTIATKMWYLEAAHYRYSFPLDIADKLTALADELDAAAIKNFRAALLASYLYFPLPEPVTSYEEHEVPWYHRLLATAGRLFREGAQHKCWYLLGERLGRELSKAYLERDPKEQPCPLAIDDLKRHIGSLPPERLLLLHSLQRLAAIPDLVDNDDLVKHFGLAAGRARPMSVHDVWPNTHLYGYIFAIDESIRNNLQREFEPSLLPNPVGLLPATLTSPDFLGLRLAKSGEQFFVWRQGHSSPVELRQEEYNLLERLIKLRGERLFVDDVSEILLGSGVSNSNTLRSTIGRLNDRLLTLMVKAEDVSHSGRRLVEVPSSSGD